MTAPPLMSLFLYTAHDYAAVHATLVHLQRQTLAARLELLLYARDRERVVVPPPLRQCFAEFRLLQAPTILQARCDAVQAAQAPIIAYCEEHAFPATDWAEQLLAAHRLWDVVAPAIANPASSSLSEADFLLNFAAYAAPTRPRHVDHLPGHNTSYKRGHLLQLGGALQPLLISERLLHDELVRRGYKLFLTADTQLQHVNISRLTVFFAHKLDGGRLFSAVRARRWPLWRRCLYIALTPLIPAARLRPIVRRSVQLRDYRSLLRTLPWLLLGAGTAALGEMLGYALGAGGALNRYITYEVNRMQHVSKADQAAIAALIADVS